MNPFTAYKQLNDIEATTEETVNENLFATKPQLNFEIQEGAIIEDAEDSDELIGNIDFFKESDDDLDSFEERAWKKGAGYKLPNFPEVEERLEGLESGLYIFAGESNMGKTAAMMAMLYDVGMCEENNVLALLITIDDTKDEVLPRVIAAEQRIPISAVGKPSRYVEEINNGSPDTLKFEEYLEKRKKGIQLLKDKKNMFKVVDALKDETKNLRYAEGIEEYIRKLVLYLKAVDPERKLVVGIDSLNDVQHMGKSLEAKERNEKTAKWSKGLAKRFDIPVFGTTHLRKLNGNRRPTTEDLKDTVEYQYESSVLFLVYNDVSKNKEAAGVFYTDTEIEGRRPIIELDWAKNKKSSYKGRTYSFFVPDQSRLQEVDAETKRSYDTIILEG